MCHQGAREASAEPTNAASGPAAPATPARTSKASAAKISAAKVPRNAAKIAIAKEAPAALCRPAVASTPAYLTAERSKVSDSQASPTLRHPLREHPHPPTREGMTIKSERGVYPLQLKRVGLVPGTGICMYVCISGWWISDG